MFAFILGHNLVVGFLMVVFAPMTLGVVGGLMLLVNGFVLGYLGGVFAGFSALGYFACGTLPHGLIELIALVLAYAFALRIAATMVRPSQQGWLLGMRLAVADYGRGAVVFVPLFIIAAFIEAYVTPLVLRAC
jgi:stage II sporulation protein M